ncbi:MAG: type II toxin-antitoxin system mRNA interferase toxin, RelE/StbE family [Sulfurovum sp.]|nr:type II toxin-antitoxin system mRNA interferase toxin, RelE/StbE family [Sulfurovum sp.]
MKFSMIYKEGFHSNIKSDFKKIDKSVVEKIKSTHLGIILEDPLIHEKLKGKLSSFYSYHFTQNKVNYRIAYKIIDDNSIVFYCLIAKRENFYKSLGQRG